MISVAFYFREYDTDPLQRRGEEPEGKFKFMATEFVTKESICRSNVLHAPVTPRKFELPGAEGEEPLRNPCQDSPHVGRGKLLLLLL